MPRKPDTSIIGDVYNNLRVDALTDQRNNYGRLLYSCTCQICGKARLATKSNLIRGEIKDCGSHRSYDDISGKRFGKLTAVYVTDKRPSGKDKTKIWHCLCDCGRECDASAAGLKNGRITSCGCGQKERIKELFVDGVNVAKLKKQKTRSTNTSGVTGVSWNKSKKKWDAEITFKKVRYKLGRYDDFVDAAKARREAESKLYGDFLEWYEKEYLKKKH